MNPETIEHLLRMTHSRRNNYVIPGLDSALLGGAGKGAVRLFINSRDHQEEITPHSHRFDFECLVLQGTVTNRIWRKTDGTSGDLFMGSTLFPLDGGMGTYRTYEHDTPTHWGYEDYRHETGSWYGLDSQEVHSIRFSRDAVVLFFEGPEKRNSSLILEPFVNGQRIPTFRTEPWMFQKEC